MSIENKQGAVEPSPASDGSVVAWAVVCGDCVDSTFTDRDEAVEWASGIIPPAHIVPLYHSPTLTGAEREAVETCIADDETMTHHSRAAILRGLLERFK